MDKVHVITLVKRKDRQDNAIKQFESQGAKFVFCKGIESVPIYKGISQAHKSIVEKAQARGWKRVIIAEDDINFLGQDALKYFLDNEPIRYDIYTGSFFDYENGKQDGLLRGFQGLTLYMVHERFYDTFINIPEDNHLDVNLYGKGLYKACPKIVAGQIKTYSDNKKMMAHPTLPQDYPLFNDKE